MTADINYPWKIGFLTDDVPQDPRSSLSTAPSISKIPIRSDIRLVQYNCSATILASCRKQVPLTQSSPSQLPTSRVALSLSTCTCRRQFLQTQRVRRLFFMTFSCYGKKIIILFFLMDGKRSPKTPENSNEL
ncbi:hypothetical protein M438DRAFT_99281 [Aureobasidium pullulans EXF-150]|uniref:Uncharacterized protein n=1 Tax=Aureobasidium pullulans EXF-150 TaxID=1043002 RepID=A0A074X6U5_AURPU|nr:uncharacterized protein M438DRAFT_99281 [Aureobasidium pullulans EXF-150]KEQ81220.1 hypothetical protein M438DRAFT_99281 [Aureobasidium pullulans EXF-150]